MLRPKINTQMKLLKGALGLLSVSNTLPSRYNVSKYLDMTTKCKSNFSLLNNVKKRNPPAFPSLISTKKHFSTNQEQNNQETKNEGPQENKNTKGPWITWNKVAGFAAGVVIYEVFKDVIHKAFDQSGEGSSRVEELIYLGNSSVADRKHEEAIKHFQEAYDLRKKLSGDKDDPELRAILAFMGYAYLALENYAEAIRCLEQSNEMNKRLNPEQDGQDSELSSTLELIGHTQLSRRNFDDALKYYGRVYEIGKKKNDEGHAFICESIGMCHEELKNYKEAIKYYKEAYEIKKLLSVTNLHPELENSAMLVAKALRQAGNKKEADAYQNEVNEIVNKLKK